MNNYRKKFPYLTITGLLLFVVACNPFPTNLHPEIVEAPIIITTNPVPNQPNAQIALLFDTIDKGDVKSFQETWIQLKAANPTIDLSQFTDALGNTFLHRAAEKGNNLLLEFLVFHSIDKKTYINTVNYLDQTPLHIAVIHKRLDSIEWLIAAGADPMVYDLEGFTPLHIAIIDGNLDIVERLIQGSNVIALIGLPTKVEGHTAIRLAYMKKHTDVLRYLMHFKYYKSNEKLTGSELLMALEYEWVDLIETLIKTKRIEVNQKGILQLAANKGYLPLLEYLIEQLGKDINEINEIHDFSKKDIKNTAVYQAVRGSHPKVIHYLLQKGAKQHIDKEYDAYNSDLLGIALETYIKNKQQAIPTQDTTTLNATNNEADKKLSTAKKVIDIILASRRANFDLPIITTAARDKQRYTLSPEILSLASRAGLDIFKLVLSHSYASDRKEIVTDIKEGYYNPIHGASKAGDTKLVEYLLSMNANVNIESFNGTTPLIHAVKSGNPKTVQYLLAKRATVNAQGENNYTPLYQAVKRGHKGIFELLLNHGARILDKEDDENTLLHAAALSKNVVGADTTETRISIQDIIARIGVKRINDKDSFGCTPLYYAAQGGNQSLVSALLAAGANLNAHTEENQTPLGLALDANNLVTAKHLLVAGTNLDKCFFRYRPTQDKLLKLILFILNDKEEIVGENITLVNKLIKKADEITLRKLVINVLIANPQTVSLQEKCFCDRVITEHNIQLTDCLARIIADYQFDDRSDYQLDKEEILSFMYQLIELYGLSPVDCIYQLILSKKENTDPLLYHLINKYKVSPLHLLNNAIIQGREDIVSLLIEPYHKSIKNTIIKQCITTNDLNIIKLLIRYDETNNSSDNLNCIISQAIKLNKPDIIQFLINQCYLDPKIVVSSVIKEISKPVYSTNMYKFAQDLMESNRLQTQDFAIWAAAADMFETVKYILMHYNLSRQELIDYAEKMNNAQAVSFLKRVVQIGKIVDLLNEPVHNGNLESFFTKRQKK